MQIRRQMEIEMLKEIMKLRGTVKLIQMHYPKRWPMLKDLN
jgi:hypothetical protein